MLEDTDTTEYISTQLPFEADWERPDLGKRNKHFQENMIVVSGQDTDYDLVVTETLVVSPFVVPEPGCRNLRHTIRLLDVDLGAYTLYVKRGKTTE